MGKRFMGEVLLSLGLGGEHTARQEINVVRLKKKSL